MQKGEEVLEKIKEVKRATAGFAISLIAGILILINGALFIWLSTVAKAFDGFMSQMPMGAEEAFKAMESIGIIMGAIGLAFGIIVLIGAILIYMPGKEVIGGILVLVFSILSVFIGGGFFIGVILGIIGGVLGLVKK